MAEGRIVDELGYAEALKLFLCEVRKPLRCVDLECGKNLFISLLALDPYERNGSILDGDGLLKRYHLALFCDHFTGRRIDYFLCEGVALDTVLEVKLLIKLITADVRKIIAARVEEHAV